MDIKEFLKIQTKFDDNIENVWNKGIGIIKYYSKSSKLVFQKGYLYYGDADVVLEKIEKKDAERLKSLGWSIGELDSKNYFKYKL